MMNLNQQNHLAHDDLTTSKTFIAQLLQDIGTTASFYAINLMSRSLTSLNNIEFERKARARAEDSLRHAQEMKYELEKKEKRDLKAESGTQPSLYLSLSRFICRLLAFINSCREEFESRTG